jgi:DNA processing protein
VHDTSPNQERLALLALHFVPGLGNYTIRQLVSYCGSAAQVFRKPKGKLLKIPGIGPKIAEALVNGKPFTEAEKEWRRAEKENVKLIFYTDKNYPSRLKDINDAPSLLYTRGNIDFENPRTVGIVGTRKATPYGKERVDELVEGLLPHGALIVSGLAYGIDIYAHKAALKHGLPTVAVMGSGIDIIYPSAHRETARKMEAHGGLVTENPFGTAPDAHNFPQRNRIIAGLCDALIVVEAAATGGALITAELANSYNRDVFAIPGSVGIPTSEGCNHLIKTNRAHLMTSVKDLEYVMNWRADMPPLKQPAVSRDTSSLSENERAVIAVLQGKSPLQLDELSWRTNIPVNQLAAILLNLEFSAWVKALPGKMYALVS